MDGFAGILLKMRTRDADGFNVPVVELYLYGSLADHRQFILRNLISLGQVGIEIIFACKHGTAGHSGIDRQPKFHRHAHCLGIEHRQHAGETEIDCTGLSVGFSTIGRGGTGKYFATRSQLGMDFQTNDDFPFHKALLTRIPAVREDANR